MDTQLPVITLEIQPHDGTGFTASVCIPLLIKHKDGVWIAHSPVFGTVGHSSVSEEAAIEDHDADVQAFLGINFKKGTLASALTRLGWQVTSINGTSLFQRTHDIPVQLLKHTRVSKTNYELAHA